MAGRGSLAGMMPYGDANAIVLEMVSSVKFVVLYESIFDYDAFYKLCAKKGNTRKEIPPSDLLNHCTNL